MALVPKVERCTGGPARSAAARRSQVFRAMPSVFDPKVRPKIEMVSGSIEELGHGPLNYERAEPVSRGTR